MNADEHEYDYKPRWRMIVIPAVIGVPGAICNALALFNGRQVVMNGRPIPHADARYVLWGCFAFFVAFAALGALS